MLFSNLLAPLLLLGAVSAAGSNGSAGGLAGPTVGADGLTTSTTTITSTSMMTVTTTVLASSNLTTTTPPSSSVLDAAATMPTTSAKLIPQPGPNSTAQAGTNPTDLLVATGGAMSSQCAGTALLVTLVGGAMAFLL